MDIQSLSVSTNVLQKKLSETKQPIQVVEVQETTESDNKKKTAMILGTLAAIAVIGICIAKGIKISKLPKKLTDVVFDKGIAIVKGKTFTGTVKDILKNGDSIELNYVNGILQSSAREGAKNISKQFKYDSDGKILSVISKSGETIREFIKTKNGHIIKENKNLVKAFVNQEGKKTIAEFKNGKPIKSKSIDELGRLMKETIYEYGENGKLNKVVNKKGHYHEYFYDKISNSTTFTENQIVRNLRDKTRTITKGNNQKYGSNLSIKDTSSDVRHVRNKFYNSEKLLVEECPEYTYFGLNDYGYGGYEQGGKWERINVTDYRNGEPQYISKRIYEDGKEDILLSGREFGAPTMEIEYKDENGNTTGYLSSKFLRERDRYHQCHGIYSCTDDVLITQYDKNHNPIKSYNSTNHHEDYSSYDWD